MLMLEVRKYRLIRSITLEGLPVHERKRIYAIIFNVHRPHPLMVDTTTSEMCKIPGVGI